MIVQMNKENNFQKLKEVVAKQLKQEAADEGRGVTNPVFKIMYQNKEIDYSAKVEQGLYPDEANLHLVIMSR